MLKRPLDHPAHAASARISSPLLPPSPDVPTPLLGNLTPTQFMRRYWQKKPLLIRQAIPNVAAPLSRDELAALKTTLQNTVLAPRFKMTAAA